jgi:hypothetical protein
VRLAGDGLAPLRAATGATTQAATPATQATIPVATPAAARSVAVQAAARSVVR